MRHNKNKFTGITLWIAMVSFIFACTACGKKKGPQEYMPTMKFVIEKSPATGELVAIGTYSDIIYYSDLYKQKVYPIVVESPALSEGSRVKLYWSHQDTTKVFCSSEAGQTTIHKGELIVKVVES